MPEDFCSVREYAVSRGITIPAVYVALWAGRIPGARKVGKRWEIPTAHLETKSMAQWSMRSANPGYVARQKQREALGIAETVTQS